MFLSLKWPDLTDLSKQPYRWGTVREPRLTETQDLALDVGSKNEQSDSADVVPTGPGWHECSLCVERVSSAGALYEEVAYHLQNNQ